jgi:hypothetical protein
MSRARPEIETFTGNRWEMKDWPELHEWASEYDNFLKQFPAYDYAVFLRHHRFPSPLLDWTHSPYIAAYFAFAEERDVKRVAIYVYWEYTGHGKVGSANEPQIKVCGPYVRSHSRHFLQKSEYTIAAQFKREWWFAPHEDVFAASSAKQDRLWKITLPTTERVRVLRALDDYNLNDFSLFRTEEALLRSIAVREMLLRG